MIWLPRVMAPVFVSLLLACGDGEMNASSSEGSSGEATGSGSTTQNVPSNPSTTNGSTQTSNASGGADESSGGGSASGSSTGEPPGGSSGTASTGDASSSGGTAASEESSSGGGGIGPFGDCVGEMAPCPDGSFCLLVPGSGICTPEGCNDASDCPAPPPGGDAVVICADANDDGIDDCRIDCSKGRLCPTGMECFSNEICVWS